jgi:archaellum component FlaD/FlaE
MKLTGNKINLNSTTLEDWMAKQSFNKQQDSEVVKTASVKDDVDDDVYEKKEEEKEEECEETDAEEVEEKEEKDDEVEDESDKKEASSKTTFVKVANLNSEAKAKLREYYAKYYPKAYADALLEDK